jgi:four helix bundle protein
MEKNMQREAKKIKSFTDLQAWQSSRKLVRATYKAVEKFPPAELYGLTSQMKRASISIASNIAEGFKRDTMRDKVHFYIMAHGSLTELQNQIILAQDLAYINHAAFTKLGNLSSEADKLLTGLVRASKERL